MEMNRVKQIVSSPKEITVKYNGVPVWIQGVDEQANTARVYAQLDPDDEMDVSIRELLEE
jgi:small acid-soluble spore protein H (minor)